MTSTSSVLVTALLGGLLALASIGAAIQFRIQTRRNEIELRRLEAELRVQDRLRDESYSMARTVMDLQDAVDRMSRQSLQVQDVIAAQFDESSDQLRSLIRTEITRARQLLISAPDVAPKPVLDEKESGQGSFALVSELAHSLKTPLAHVESSLLELMSSVDNSETVRNIATEADASVEIVKATLSAYQELTQIAERAETWSPSSLYRALITMHVLCNRQAEKDTSLLANLPSTVPGYSNNYILALLLPLLENAVEASPRQGLVGVNFHHSTNVVLISVENKVQKPFERDKWSIRGASSKDGHEGLGKAIVDRMLEAQRGASLQVVSWDDLVRVTVTLPGRVDG